METFLVTARSKPAPNSDNFGRYTGALWTIWVVAISELDAIAKARAHIERGGWIEPQFVNVAVVTREKHQDDPELLERFDRSQQIGIAAIFDTLTGGGQFN